MKLGVTGVGLVDICFLRVFFGAVSLLVVVGSPSIPTSLLWFFVNF